MTYFEDEILNEMQVGTEYTEREIKGLVTFNRNVVILCPDTYMFNSSNRDRKYKVTDKFISYIHKNDNQTYIAENSTKTFYRVEKI